MNHTGISSNGPKCFGTTVRTSFVDIRDDDIPGTGTHNPSRIDKNTPSKWKFSNDTQRDTFLQKYPRPNPPPNHYKININPTITSHAKYSIPKSQVKNPAQYKQDDGCVANYKPKPNFPKQSPPNYSFGYSQQMDYTTKVPAPNTYMTDRSSLNTKSQFNKTQRHFSNSDRPLPYGEQGKNPGIAGYQINSKDPMNKTAYVFGSGDRPKVCNGPDAPGIYYEISNNIKQPGKGYSIRPFYEGVKNKDFQQFPASNHYNPKQLNSKQRIINFVSNRSELYNKDHVKYPSPQKHVTSSDFYKKKKALSFTQEVRYTPKPNINPGPGTHQIQNTLNTVKGYMGRKVNKLTQFVNPGADHYKPNYDVNKDTPQRTINYYTNRTDFSKSITGKKVGPGGYETQTKKHLEYGKIGKSDKFAKNRNKNPGPGDYEIPGTIGKLPKYYCGSKKMTNDGFSTYALMTNEKIRNRQQRIRNQQKRRLQEQQRLLNQQQQIQQKGQTYQEEQNNQNQEQRQQLNNNENLEQIEN